MVFILVLHSSTEECPLASLVLIQVVIIQVYHTQLLEEVGTLGTYELEHRYQNIVQYPIQDMMNLTILRDPTKC